MEGLAVLVALNGAVVLLVTSLAGVILARTIHVKASSEHWHLLHAGGTSRGVMLLALASTIRLAALPEAHLWWIAALIVFFVWTSVLAMLLRALSHEKGFHPGGPWSNRMVFGLYACGTLALCIGLPWFIAGLLRALA